MKTSDKFFSLTIEQLEDRIVPSANGIVAIGAGAGGGPHVRVLDAATMNEQVGFLAYAPNFGGGVRVATGDINGDGRVDVITAPGSGGGPNIKVFDGHSGTILRDFFAYDPGVTVGLFVEAGDVNGDGFDDIITGVDTGAGPHVRAFSGADGALLKDFFAFDPGFSGGVRVAANDVDGDGRDDIIVAAGPGGGPHVKVFNALTNSLLFDQFVYAPTFNPGIYVAAGDFNGDGRAEIVTGPDAGGGPHVRVFDIANNALLKDFFAYDPAFTGGVRPSVQDVNRDGIADLITFVGPGGGPNVRAFHGADNTVLQDFFAFDGGLTGGGYIAGQGLATRIIDGGDAVKQSAAGGSNFARIISDPVTTGGLPRNEARQSELDSGVFAQEVFVPAQLGADIMTAILGNAFRLVDPSYTQGFTSAELRGRLNAAFSAAENIFANHAFTDNVTGGKAFFQFHRIGTGEAVRDSAFARTVSLLDNMWLATSLQAAASYLAPRMPDLAARAAALLGQFDFGMWLVGNSLVLGGPDDPRIGNPIDRITTEGRLAPVLAFALGHITLNEFQSNIDSMIINSQIGMTPGGVDVQYLPVFGTALEIWAAKPYLSNEQFTFYETDTLIPLTEGWEESRQSIAVPAAGATGIADGFGGFKGFGLSPSEQAAPFADQLVLVPPAAGMMAGGMGTPLAVQNLVNTVNAVKNAGQWHPLFGFSNYLDVGATGLVNSVDPVRGTLEIGQSTVALLNRLLGGGFIENLLRQNAGWNNALNQYEQRINVREAEFNPTGNGGPQIIRGNASTGNVWHLDLNETATYDVTIGRAGAYQLIVRYSNDDTGVGDTVTILVNGGAVGNFQTQDTGNGGAGWDVFVNSPPVNLGNLPTGPIQISLRIDADDGFGVDFDRLSLI